MTYAQGAQIAGLNIANLNMPSMLASGDMRNVDFNLRNFKANEKIDTTVFLGDDNKVVFTKGIYAHKVKEAIVSTNEQARVTTIGAGIFAGSKNNLVTATQVGRIAVSNATQAREADLTLKNYWYEAEVIKGGAKILAGEVSGLSVGGKDILDISKGPQLLTQDHLNTITNEKIPLIATPQQSGIGFGGTTSSKVDGEKITLQLFDGAQNSILSQGAQKIVFSPSDSLLSEVGMISRSLDNVTYNYSALQGKTSDVAMTWTEGIIANRDLATKILSLKDGPELKLDRELTIKMENGREIIQGVAIGTAPDGRQYKITSEGISLWNGQQTTRSLSLKDAELTLDRDVTIKIVNGEQTILGAA
ncbi:MAG: hypothetical protein WCY12_07175, partial [Candidatus Omnitrophota bacterium]